MEEGPLVECVAGPLVAWVAGPLVACVAGPLVAWVAGPLVAWVAAVVECVAAVVEWVAAVVPWLVVVPLQQLQEEQEDHALKLFPPDFHKALAQLRLSVTLHGAFPELQLAQVAELICHNPTS